jgi:colanic acid/amylovoran biosynthesis protein
MELLIQLKSKMRGRDGKGLKAFLECMSQADLFVVSGMGGITDAFRAYALEVLQLLDLAIRCGARTALVGQGIGPIHDRVLRKRAEAVLPRVDFISLREGRTGSPVLTSLGVAADRVLVTGDDAIEVAYQQRSERFGDGLGVNLRAAAYAGVDRPLVERVWPLLHDAARQCRAPLIPVPISRSPGEADADTLGPLLADPKEWQRAADIDSPAKVVAQIQRCRAIVTGSYHAAVFALSLGIPTVCLANSAYYVAKFEGLADQFGTACELIQLRDDGLAAKMTDAVMRAWQSAERVRPQLLARAAQQVELGHTAYRRIYEMATSRGHLTLQGGEGLLPPTRGVDAAGTH